MATLTFETLQFSDQPDQLQVDFLRMYSFSVPKTELADFGPMIVECNTLEFPEMGQGSAERKFNFLLSKGFLHLKNKVSGKPTVYIHKGSGIPLRGHIAFGLIDRGSNIIEVKPITSCNIKCTYCSVNEDVRPVDFIVEKDYLVEEFKKLIAEKGVDGIEAHIASQGEPTLYADLVPLVRDLAAIPQVSQITTDTNATVLTIAKVDELVAAGFTRFNISINAMDPEVARKIANAPYNIEHVKSIAKHIAFTSGALMISPTYIPGVNDAEIPKILAFVKTLENPKWKPRVGIQNFLEYRFGRNAAKQMEWEPFFAKLKAWQEEFGIKLMLEEGDFDIKKSPTAPKVFNRDEIVKAEIKCRGRLGGEKIAVARGYCISVPKCRVDKGFVKLKITKTKHHVYMGELLG